MASQVTATPQMFMAPPTASGGNSTTTMIIVLIVFVIFISMSVAAYFLFFKKEEGKECKIKDGDKNGVYKYDEDLDCVLDGCKKGYEVSGTKCITERKPGDSCFVTGGDSKGTYKLDAFKKCVLKSCTTGYKVENGKCVSTTPASTTPASTTPALTTVPDKIWHTMTDFGWNDPGPKTLGDGSANPNVVEGASIEECWSKKPSDAVIVGHRDSSYSDAPYQNTCFYYNKPQTGAAQQAISNHMMACADPTKNINDGCWQRVISGDKIWNTTPEMGWNDPGPNTWDDGSANPNVVDGWKYSAVLGKETDWYCDSWA
jgi:hypothetical protein